MDIDTIFYIGTGIIIIGLAALALRSTYERAGSATLLGDDHPAMPLFACMAALILNALGFGISLTFANDTEQILNRDAVMIAQKTQGVSNSGLTDDPAKESEILDSRKKALAWRYILLRSLAWFIAVGAVLTLLREALRRERQTYKNLDIEPFSVREMLSTELNAIFQDSTSRGLVVIAGLANLVLLRDYVRWIMEGGRRVLVLLPAPIITETGELDETSMIQYLNAHREALPLDKSAATLLQSLRDMWLVNKAFSSESRRADVTKRILLEVKLTTQLPEGWIIADDVGQRDSQLTHCRRVYFFPYLTQAQNLDRPGYKIGGGTSQATDLLKHLNNLLESSYAPTASQLTALCIHFEALCDRADSSGDVAKDSDPSGRQSNRSREDFVSRILRIASLL